MEPCEFKMDGEYFLNGVLFVEPVLGREQLKRVKEFPMSSEDIMVVTYPKSGTTWMQEIVYLIQNGADLQEARTRNLDERVPHIDLRYPVGPSPIDKLIPMKPPRLIKSHLSVDFLRHHVTEKGAKAIVLMRNPKDTLVSYFHFYRLMKVIDFPGTWDQFFELFKAKRLLFGDVLDWNIGWWALRDHPKVKVLFYEDLRRNLAGSIQEIARFLDKDLSQSQLIRIAEETTFSSMKVNPTTNWENSPMMRKDRGSFMRKGKVGDWTKYFSAEQSKYIDNLVEKQLDPVGLHFHFHEEE